VGTGPDDFRPFLSLAWLYLRRNCQFPDKTRYLLEEVERKIPNLETPFVFIVWGYYQYRCRHDPEKALIFLGNYLSGDPGDEAARKLYQKLKAEAGKGR
jgi:hypothetical protein